MTGKRQVPPPETVAGRSAPGPAEGFPGPGQPLRRLPRPGQPPRPCEAAWSPVPPFKGRSDRLHPREAALGGRRAGGLPSGQGCPTARRDRAARWRSARLRPRRCPRRSRRRHRPRRCPTTGVPLRPEGRSAGGPSSIGRRPPRIGPAGEPPGTAPGRGGGPGPCQQWQLYIQPAAFCQRSFLRTQPPASVAFGSVLPTHGPCSEPLHGEPLHGEPPRGVLRNTPEVERGRAAPALRASDLPHWPYTAESARPPITVIGKMRRGPLQREAGTREGGRPAVLPVSGQESGGGRSRLLPSNKAPASCRLSPM
jgi:hypothetical protein